MLIGSKTNKGLVRGNNQDCYYVGEIHPQSGETTYYCIVADGMGGHKAGEIASAMAVDTIRNYIEANLIKQAEPALDSDVSQRNMVAEAGKSGAISYDIKKQAEPALDSAVTASIEKAIVEAFKKANTEIVKKSFTDESLDGMGTTGTMCLITHQKTIIAANVGDSRMYLIRDGVIKQITKDHSMVEEMIQTGIITNEEAKNHPQKNIITRAIGGGIDIQVDLHTFKGMEGDILVLCTDGLTNLVSDNKILEIVNSQTDLQKVADELVALANKEGGFDNITVVIMKI